MAARAARTIGFLRTGTRDEAELSGSGGEYAWLEARASA
jgi:hypothetical protein